MAFKAVFLDRDNTIIEDPGYINHPNQVELLPGVGNALIDMRNMGYKLIIVTNQSGIARGIVTEETLSQIHQRLVELLRKEGVFIDGIYYCPFHPDGVIEKYRKESRLRKPAPGMLLLAAEEMDIDLNYSWMIGNSYRDIQAGKLAGCRTILINSPTHPAIKEYSDPEPDSVAVNIKEAANIIKMCIRDGKLPFKVAEKRKVPNNRQPIHQQEENEEETIITDQPQTPPEKHMQPAQDEEYDDYEETNNERRNYQPGKQDDDYDDNEDLYDENEDDYYDGHDRHDRHAEYDLYEEYGEFEELSPEDKNIFLLKQIVNKLGKPPKDELYEDFSIMKVFAGIFQIAVIFCIILSVWFLLDQTRDISWVHTTIGYAVLLQLMSIAFYIMDWRN